MGGERKYVVMLLVLKVDLLIVCLGILIPD